MPGKEQTTPKSEEFLPSLFSTQEMDRIFSLSNQLRCMVRFESALSSALEANSLATPGSSAAMEPLLDAKFVDVPRLLNDAQKSASLAVPFVRQLTAAVREQNTNAAATVHLGATSQDVLDTALALQMKDALEIIHRDLDSLQFHLLRQVRTHAETVLSGRTLLQQAPPVTLGLKFAGYLEALRRHRERINAAAVRSLVLQFGGAVGTLAALGNEGTAVATELARKLNLPEPRIPWHTHRDSLVELASTLALLTATLGKMARDISLLMQSEVGEVLEPSEEGRGASSTMPHKRNPVASAIILAAAVRTPGLIATLLEAMVQEHERGLGGWHAEWETIPQVFRLCAVALARSIEIASALEVRPQQMSNNIESNHGLLMAEAVTVALTPKMDRIHARAILQHAVFRARTEERHLREILLEMPEVRACLDESALNRLFEPRNYLGSTQEWIARVMEDFNADR